MESFESNPSMYAPDLIGCGLDHGADPWDPEKVSSCFDAGVHIGDLARVLNPVCLFVCCFFAISVLSVGNMARSDFSFP